MTAGEAATCWLRHLRTLSTQLTGDWWSCEHATEDPQTAESYLGAVAQNGLIRVRRVRNQSLTDNFGRVLFQLVAAKCCRGMPLLVLRVQLRVAQGAVERGVVIGLRSNKSLLKTVSACSSVVGFFEVLALKKSKTIAHIMLFSV